MTEEVRLHERRQYETPETLAMPILGDRAGGALVNLAKGLISVAQFMIFCVGLVTVAQWVLA